MVVSRGKPRFFTLDKLAFFSGARSTAFLHYFHEQSILVGAVESCNLRCTAVSSLNRRAPMWLQAEPKLTTHVQLPDSAHQFS